MKKRIGLAILMLPLAVAGAIQNAFASERVEVTLGYSHVVGPVANMSTVIVGDNSVADATLGGGGTIVLTGKSLGATNLIILDESGGQLLSSPVVVVPLDRRPTRNVRVVNGVSTGKEYVCGRDSGCTVVAEAAAAPQAPAAPQAATVVEEKKADTPAKPAEAAGTDETTDNTGPQEQVSLNP